MSFTNLRCNVVRLMLFVNLYKTTLNLVLPLILVTYVLSYAMTHVAVATCFASSCPGLIDLHFMILSRNLNFSDVRA